MARPLTRDQHLENAAFLTALRRTGNVREAARDLGVHRATFIKRRDKHPCFALAWDAALAVAHAGLSEPGDPAASAIAPRIVRSRSGNLQLRQVKPGRLDRVAEQAFLAALSATANIRLSAAAAGFSHSAFYARRRQNPGFAREMRLALAMGYERLEQALIESYLPRAHVDDAWRHNDPPAIPPMSADEALMLLRLHQQEVRLQAEPPHIKRRRGESGEAHSYRLAAMYEAEKARDREDFEIAEAARNEGAGGTRFEPPAPVLPDLAQVSLRLRDAEHGRQHRAIARRRGRTPG